MAVIINSMIPKTGVGRVLAVARAFGGKPKPLTRDAIAGKLNLRAGTGSANNRVIAAKKFGVIETGRAGGYVLTELGRRLAVSEPRREDIVAAIRNVDAFAKLIDEVGDPGELADADIRQRLKAAGVREAELDTASRVFAASWAYGQPETSEVANGDGGGGAPVQAREDEATGQTAVTAVDATAGPDRGTPFHEHQMVGWVLEQAPAIGEAWPAERYDAWSELLHTTIRFLYPDTARGG